METAKNFLWQVSLLCSGVVLIALAGFCALEPILADAHIGSAQVAAIEDSERPFLIENHRAMDRMMEAMAARPTGDIDADFATIMIPHHQGAIDMAALELRYGRNELLRRIAQEIIVDQQQEIAAMRLALDQPLPHSTAAAADSYQKDIRK